MRNMEIPSNSAIAIPEILFLAKARYKYPGSENYTDVRCHSDPREESRSLLQTEMSRFIVAPPEPTLSAGIIEDTTTRIVDKPLQPEDTSPIFRIKIALRH